MELAPTINIHTDRVYTGSGIAVLQSALEIIAVFCIAFSIVVILQWRENAFHSEWDGSADEPAHYVTGLLLHDYIAQGLPQHPEQFAQNYYDHYPKVALGHWPPVFYLVEAAWTLALGVSRISVLLMMAALSASVFTLLYVVSARIFPNWIAFCGALGISTVPVVQTFSRLVGPDMLVALLSLLAVLALSRHLENPTWRTGIVFGLLASATLLTKGTGLVLVPLPVLGAVALKRWWLFRTPAFWSPLLIGCLCVPWFLMAPDALHQSVARFGGLQFQLSSLSQSASFLIRQIGIVGSALVVIGAVRQIQGRFGRDPLWMLLSLLLPIAIVLRMFIHVWDAVYLVSALPAIVPLFCAGLESLTVRWVRTSE